ncbi:unnamed protein product [Lactuca saligna]|uniref:DUF4283 domain-containing protein n=1 Tax=Lactuca saligna TaxID=75948 RepID=A0AA36A0P9_LACSI|nr:unnamed protein product [Lactuca saligna]
MILDDSPLHSWLKGKLTLIGKLHSFDRLENAPYSFKNCDGSYCEIKYLGDIYIGVKFVNKDNRKVFTNTWTDWFTKVGSGDVAITYSERIAWIKILGLPPEVCSKENFSMIAEFVGRVVVRCVVDQSTINLSYGKVGILTPLVSTISSEPVVEVNGRIIKLQNVEVDLDWAPFKQRYYSTEVSSSSEDGYDDNDGEGVDGYMVDTIPSKNINEDLGEGEIGHTDTEFVKDSYIDNMQVDVRGNVRSPEVNSAPVEDATGENDRVTGNALPGEHQRSVKDIIVHGEQLDNQTQCWSKMNVGQDEWLNGPLKKLDRSSGLRLFTNNSESGENQRCHTGVNFEG